MADSIEEGAGISYGFTIREATRAMITLFKEHCKQVPQHKDAQRAYHRIYSVQADYGGVQLNNLGIFLFVLPLSRPGNTSSEKRSIFSVAKGQKPRRFGPLATTKADLAEIDTAAAARMITVVAVAERVMDPPPDVIKVLLANETA